MSTMQKISYTYTATHEGHTFTVTSETLLTHAVWTKSVQLGLPGRIHEIHRNVEAELKTALSLVTPLVYVPAQ